VIIRRSHQGKRCKCDRPAAVGGCHRLLLGVEWARSFPPSQRFHQNSFLRRSPSGGRAGYFLFWWNALDRGRSSQRFGAQQFLRGDRCRGGKHRLHSVLVECARSLPPGVTIQCPTVSPRRSPLFGPEWGGVSRLSPVSATGNYHHLAFPGAEIFAVCAVCWMSPVYLTISEVCYNFIVKASFSNC